MNHTPLRADLTDHRFGRLVAQRWVANDGSGNAIWLCVCDCGKVCRVRARELLNGHTRSCGCLAREVTAKRCRKHSHTTHCKKSATYCAFGNARQRCVNPKVKGYIGVAFLFRDFAQFLAEVGPQPSPNHRLLRIDVAGDYEADNLHWVEKRRRDAHR